MTRALVGTWSVAKRRGATAPRLRPISRWLIAACAAISGFGSAAPSLAQCFPIARAEPQVVPAAYRQAALAAGTVRLTFLGHSSFWIESAGGATAITDFNGMIIPPQTPDMVTMNNAHSSHYTEFVDPAVKYVLRGWDPAGGVALHDVTLTIPSLIARLYPSGGGVSSLLQPPPPRPPSPPPPKSSKPPPPLVGASVFFGVSVVGTKCAVKRFM